MRWLERDPPADYFALSEWSRLAPFRTSSPLSVAGGFELTRAR